MAATKWERDILTTERAKSTKEENILLKFDDLASPIFVSFGTSW
jgi:hypothetical protein